MAANKSKRLSYKSSQKNSIRKIISVVFGVSILGAGLIAGVILVIQPQLFNQKAAGVDYIGPCGPNLSCVSGFTNPPNGSTVCKSNNVNVPYLSCCNAGYRIYKNTCYKLCDFGLSCGSVKNRPKGSSICAINSETVPFASCCPAGKVIFKETNTCVKPCGSGLVCSPYSLSGATSSCLSMATGGEKMVNCCAPDYTVSGNPIDGQTCIHK